MLDLLDVTIRDGGYVNDHGWTCNVAAQIMRTMTEAGIFHTEVGYLRDQHDPDRPSASCPPAYLEQLASECTRARITVMIRPGEVSERRIAELPQLGVNTVRVLAPNGDVSRAAPYLDAATAAGLRTSANLIRISEVDPASLASTVRRCVSAGADIVYLADSNGSMFPNQVREHVEAALVAAAGKAQIGFHPHDNLSMAFINACVAVDAGAESVDASLGGIGKGGGNLRIDLIAAYWKVRYGTPIHVTPLLRKGSLVNDELIKVAAGVPISLVSGLLNLNIDQLAALPSTESHTKYDELLTSTTSEKS